MPAFPCFGVRASDGSNYLHTNWEINRKKSHTNKSIFKREIYIEYTYVILEKDKR